MAVIVTRIGPGGATVIRIDDCAADVHRNGSGSASAECQPEPNAVTEVIGSAAVAAGSRPSVDSPFWTPGQIITGEPLSAVATALCGTVTKLNVTGDCRPVSGMRSVEVPAVAASNE